MNSSNLSHRKRALYTGLQPFLRDSELMSALVLWESKYASKPMFSVRYFIDDLQSLVDRKIDIKRLHIGLVSTLNKPEKDLLPDPSMALAAFKARNKIEQDYSYQIPELEAFQLFVAKWFKMTPSNEVREIVVYCLNQLDRQRIGVDLRNNLELFLTDPSKKMKLLQADIKDLRKITNLIYRAYCEIIGPVKADELMAQAVHAVRNNGGAAYSELYAKLL